MITFSSASRASDPIFGIVLAAGKSERMGKSKQLMPFGDQTVIETVIARLVACDLEEVIVVLGHDAEEVLKALAGWPVRAIVNSDYEEGMLSSIKRGVQACGEMAKAFLINLCDQPFITEEIINKVIFGYRKSNLGIVLPSYRGRKGHPVMLSSKYREEILGLPAEVGLRQLMWEHADDTLRVAVASDEVLRDMDYPEDYEKERAAASLDASTRSSG